MFLRCGGSVLGLLRPTRRGRRAGSARLFCRGGPFRSL
jgi:hypothetical protein